MISFFLAIALSGNCHAVAIQAVQQVAVAQYYPVVPVWYVAGQESYLEQRVKLLEQIAEQQQQLNQRLAMGSQSQGVSQLETEARAILNTKCVKCHQGDKPKGGIALDGELTTAQKLLIADIVQSGEMPPKPAKELSDDEFDTLNSWSKEDRAAVRALLKSK